MTQTKNDLIKIDNFGTQIEQDLLADKYNNPDKLVDSAPSSHLISQMIDDQIKDDQIENM